MSKSADPKIGMVFRPLLETLKKIEYGTFIVVFPNDQRVELKGRHPGPTAEIYIRSQNLMYRLLTNGTLGLAESFMAGEWSSPNLVAVIEVGEMNRAILGGLDRGHFWMRALQWVVHALRANTKRGAKKNIASHYDLGNDFYKLWLDPTLTYSSAIFENETQSLEHAQLNKYDRILSLIKPTQDAHVLEIGSGWGGFAMHAAQKTGCRVTSITLSREQLAEAQARTQAAGLNERVTFRLQDYRDVKEQYDGIASIEMFEAVGEKYWPDFFKAVHDRLKPSASAGIQVITIRDDLFSAYRKGVEFIQRYLFPGGMLPSPQVFAEISSDAGLKTIERSFHGLDYARTLREWDERFVDQLGAVRAMGFDERFIRMWRFYLAYCEGGFRRETINLMQIAMQRA